VDLTRIWTTVELAEWFRDLALAEADLRREIKKYEIESLTPLDFGPKIRSHPAMMITANNKMGSAQHVSQNYSGRLIQTSTFKLGDIAWLENNLIAGSSLINQIGEPTHMIGGSKPVWSGVSWEAVHDFLAQYAFDPRSIYEKEALRQYIRQQAQNGELVDWHVAIRGRENFSESLGTEPSIIIGGNEINRISRTRLKSAPNSIGTLVNPATLESPGNGDEEIGISQADVDGAREGSINNTQFKETLRRCRDRREGLLLLYPISPYSRPNSDDSKTRSPLFDDPENVCTIMGLAMAFPYSDNPAATIEYVVGSVGSLPEAID